MLFVLSSYQSSNQNQSSVEMFVSFMGLDCTNRNWHFATLVINFQEMFFAYVTYIFLEFTMGRNITEEYSIAEKEDLIRRFFCVCFKVFAPKTKCKKSFDWAAFCHLFCLC